MKKKTVDKINIFASVSTILLLIFGALQFFGFEYQMTFVSMATFGEQAEPITFNLFQLFLILGIFSAIILIGLHLNKKL